MYIEYRTQKDLPCDQLYRLFLAVGWATEGTTTQDPRLKPFAGKREEIIPIFPKTDFLIKSFCPICLHQPFGALAGFPAPAHQLSADSLPLECRQDSQVINDRAEMQVAESPDASYQSAIGPGGEDTYSSFVSFQ